MTHFFPAVFAVLLFALPAIMRGAESSDDAVQLYVPDGQLKSQLIRVYVNRNITEGMKPELVLHAAHSLTRTQSWENTPIPFYRISRDHRWTQKLDSLPHEKRGTLLLFDLHKIKMAPYKAMTRVTPTLIWKERDEVMSVTGESEVYLAQPVVAILWSVVVLIFVGMFIFYMSWETTKETKRPLLARMFAGLATTEGSLSMWRAQLFAWTVAIGGVVFGYGMIRLEVPEIPETLVALMGLSLVTGGLGALGKPLPKNSRRGAVAAPGVALAPTVPLPPPPAAPNSLPMRLSDLITDFNRETQTREVSVAKTQMVFWTILTLGIFLTKSMADGTLWPVPWQMVALMGMSQAGYVAAKFSPQSQ